MSSSTTAQEVSDEEATDDPGLWSAEGLRDLRLIGPGLERLRRCLCLEEERLRALERDGDLELERLLLLDCGLRLKRAS